MFNNVGQKESALFVQTYRIVNEQIWKYHGHDGKIDSTVKAIWTNIHDRLSMEFGVKELSPRYYSYQTTWMGNPHTSSGWYEMNFVVEQWMNAKFSADLDPDAFVKRRLSFIELALRMREEQVTQANAKLAGELSQAELRDKAAHRAVIAPGIRIPGSWANNLQALNDTMNRVFAENVHEVNERLKQADMPLHYHNGYLQITQDELLEKHVEQPFWTLVQSAEWKNVSIDMAEAIDRRDTGGRDPSFYAAKALESTIKIICDIKGWTTGKEKGVSDFLSHLESKANGAFIAGWERQSIQRFYSDVRNDLGHGPGSQDMPSFTLQQTDHAIEFCMSWVKSLIRRL